MAKHGASLSVARFAADAESFEANMVGQFERYRARRRRYVQCAGPVEVCLHRPASRRAGVVVEVCAPAWATLIEVAAAYVSKLASMPPRSLADVEPHVTPIDLSNGLP